ncbi:23S rRNA methyltransferase [Chromatiales bacterium (ex Bugula neritina AB1)]|nr:23S rRNA methyltransferase [Chromatiales bacterium (ex Bugula neritina AB1)]
MTALYCGIGLSNPKSPDNVGAVLRAAGCFAADEIFYTGKRYNKAVQFHTDTHAAASDIYLECVASLIDAVPEKTTIVSVELAVGAQPLVGFEHPERACYLFGPEDGTLDQQVIDVSDEVVFVPTYGCLNLAATVNVVLYDRFAKVQKLNLQNFGDELIASSRDQNNRLIVRQ